RAWATAARLAVDLVARGRLLPHRTSDGLDAWRLGPLDPDDLERRQALVDALPPAAHCTYVARSSPLAITSPDVAVDAFFDAVADVFPRTAAAEVAAGHRAYAAVEPTDVAGAATWLHEVAAGGQAEAGVSLRLLPPPEAEADDGEPTDSSS